MNRILFLIVATSVMLGMALRAPADLPVKAVYGPETLTMLPGGDHLIACVGGEFLRLVDIKTGKTLRTWQSGHTTPITNVVPSPSDNRIYTVSQNEIRAWNPFHGKMMARAEKSTSALWGAAEVTISRDGTRIVTASSPRWNLGVTLEVFDTESLALLASLPMNAQYPAVKPAITPSENLVYTAVGANNGQLVAWNYVTGDRTMLPFVPAGIGIIAVEDSPLGLFVNSTREKRSNFTYISSALCIYGLERTSTLQTFPEGLVVLEERLLDLTYTWDLVCNESREGEYLVASDLRLLAPSTLVFNAKTREVFDLGSGTTQALSADGNYARAVGASATGERLLVEHSGRISVNDRMHSGEILSLREQPWFGPIVEASPTGRLFTFESGGWFGGGYLTIDELFPHDPDRVLRNTSSTAFLHSDSDFFQGSPDGQWFLFGSSEYFLWSFAGDLIPRAYRKVSARIAPQFGGDSSTIFIAGLGDLGRSELGLFRLEDIAYDQVNSPVAVYPGGDGIHELVITNRGKALLQSSVSFEYSIRAYSVPDGMMTWSIKLPSQAWCSSCRERRLAADDAGKFVTYASRRADPSLDALMVFDQRSRALLNEVALGERLIGSNISHDGALTASVAATGRISYWDARSGELLEQDYRNPDSIMRVDFSWDSTSVYTYTHPPGAWQWGNTTPAIHSIDNPRMLGAVARERFLNGDFIRRPPVSNPYHPPTDSRDLNGDGIQDAGDLAAGFVVARTGSGKGAP